VKRASSTMGFTLLELLVTLSIIAGVIMVVLACFEGGFRVYARIRDFGNREAEIYLTGETLEQDLGYFIPAAAYTFRSRELRFSRGTLFTGDLQEVHILAPESGGLRYWVGDRGTIASGQSGITLIPEGFDVTFWFAGGESREEWVSMWESDTNTPRAVRMVVRGAVADGDLVIERTMVLASVPLEEDES